MNSCRKGKVGEREAAKFLRDIGFASARRSEQHCGAAGDADLIVEELTNLHIEVKRVQGMDVGTAALFDAMAQAIRDSAASGKVPVVLWRPNNKPWRLSWCVAGQIVTALASHELLMWLNKFAAAAGKERT